MSVSELYTDLFVLIAAMQPRAQVAAADIRTHAAKKKTATEGGPSRPSKKGRVTTPLAKESNILSEMIFEPILALSIPTILLEVPSTEDGTA